jgi:oxaloacetate decarboxylase alpha subunit
MKDYIAGYYGKAPGPLSPDVVTKVLGNQPILDPNIAPSTLVTTTYEEVAKEAGELAHSEEDVLMWALFPNEARIYLSKHRISEKTEFMLEEEVNGTKEDQSVDINQIKELVKVVEDTGIGEVTVEEAGVKVTVRAKGQLAYASQPLAADAAQAVATTEAAVSAVASSAAPTAASAAGSRPDHWIAVSSPMVGTFYSSPSPDAPPFVALDEEVVAGQSLCIVEAMKLMNEIKAEQMSVVREICIENGQAVEFGTLLFFLEPIFSATAGEAPSS